jgi:hypothetical protein
MIRTLITLALAAMAASPCIAGPNWQYGHINNITVAGDDVLVRLDTGLPDNCTGTAFGWMIVPSAAKAMKAFVLALWARGDMNSVSVTIYTDGMVGSYCQVNQVDPQE